MTVTFYINNSPDNAVSKNLTAIVSIACVFKNPSSIQTPDIIISGQDLTLFKDANYMYINTTERYYYITDVTSLKNNLVEILGRVDPLMSFKEKILANTAIISRNEKSWNLFINDGVLKTYQNPQIATSNYSAGFTKKNPSIVLAVAGGTSSS